MVRFGLEVGTVFGEDSWKIGDETSGKEKVSKEGGTKVIVQKIQKNLIL
jgi:hypothetical protein